MCYSAPRASNKIRDGPERDKMGTNEGGMEGKGIRMERGGMIA